MRNVHSWSAPRRPCSSGQGEGKGGASSGRRLAGRSWSPAEPPPATPSRFQDPPPRSPHTGWRKTHPPPKVTKSIVGRETPNPIFSIIFDSEYFGVGLNLRDIKKDTSIFPSFLKNNFRRLTLGIFRDSQPLTLSYKSRWGKRSTGTKTLRNSKQVVCGWVGDGVSSLIVEVPSCSSRGKPRAVLCLFGSFSP